MLTITNLLDSSVTNRSMMLCELNLSGTYPAGGEPLAPNKVGLGGFDFVSISAKDGYVLEYDADSRTVKVFTGPNQEAQGELNLSRVMAVFIGC